MTSLLPSQRVLLIGAGGLGSPVALILARSGVGMIDIADDDVVDVSNLQRQTLFTDVDVGQPKAVVAAKHIKQVASRAGHTIHSQPLIMRALPDNVLGLVGDYDLIIEGSDNFATKFMVADACRIAGKPLVQAGAVRWVGWTLAVEPTQGACMRCVFEDVPRGAQDTCAAAGVIGPVVGVVGALQATLALRMLGGERAAGVLVRYTALDGRIRRTRVSRQEHCPLCAGQITDIQLERYVPADCAA